MPVRPTCSERLRSWRQTHRVHQRQWLTDHKTKTTPPFIHACAKNIIANEKHKERFIHTLAPLAVRAMVCINLSSRVSMTIPLTSKSRPKLCPGGGLLASTWDIKVVKMQTPHVAALYRPRPPPRPRPRLRPHLESNDKPRASKDIKSSR